jgi:hypothetical protein
LAKNGWLPIGLLTLGFAFALRCPAQTQTVHSVAAVRHDKSKALSQMSRRRPTPEAEAGVVEHQVRPLPVHIISGRVNAIPEPNVPTSGGPLPAIVLSSFQGVGRGLGYITRSSPPDTNGSVGPDEYIQWVNDAYGIFDKKAGKLKPIFDPSTGHLETEILEGNQIWQGFGGKCEISNDGDPVVIYDKIASRWVMSQFAYSKPSSGPPYAECIAVSSSSDPAGEYARYEFDFNNFDDYPKLGVWPNGYYITFNMFEDETKGSDFLGAKVCAFERSKMLENQPANMQCANLYNPSYGGVLPADFDGSQSSMPPENSPEYFVAVDADKLFLWKFSVNWDDLTKSYFDYKPQEIAVPHFDYPCVEGDRTVSCVSQPNSSSQKLDALGDRLMFRLPYRNVGDQEVLLMNHTIKAGDSTGIRWYELSGLRGTPRIVQEGTFAPKDGLFRWIGSIAMDKNENMLLEYDVSGNNVFPSIRYTGRKKDDPKGVMRDEQLLVAGQGSQVSTVSDYITDRWGDYSSVSLDPRDDCTFWFTSQYQETTDTYRWNTVISSVRFPDCH